jgi:hypothetical protein
VEAAGADIRADPPVRQQRQARREHHMVKLHLRISYAHNSVTGIFTIA